MIIWKMRLKQFKKYILSNMERFCDVCVKLLVQTTVITNFAV